MLEVLELQPEAAVAEAEYRRLLGFPREYRAGDRAEQLAAGARRWYAKHGRPWRYLREAAVDLGEGSLRLDGMEFHSLRLHEYLRATGSRRAILVAVGAGGNCEEQAGVLWREDKPDEYFFLEVFASAVVEHLIAAANGRICGLAERDGWRAVPHYSPGYEGWDVADQGRLFALIGRGMGQAWPEPIEVLPSGMLRPKKALLAVVGLTAHAPGAPGPARLVPCGRCSFEPCQYRRVPYRAGAVRIDGAPAPATPTAQELPGMEARYTISRRALEKWAGERVTARSRPDASLELNFRFDGTTCSNLGRPLAFDYTVVLGPSEAGYPIREASCRPAPDDEGHAQMCAWLGDAAGLRRALGLEQPLRGRPLNAVLGWSRVPAPAGCLCTRESRMHKWGLALETFHYFLARSAPRSERASVLLP